ncbi:hypothetical protein E6H24_08475 [Candidatus Bathyarchaeota archaeon]|nr:MAG: hypothetical protein E6H24_08475 [Candidatus Bathyarchaeota archaeon]
MSKAKLYLSPRPEFTGVSSSFENSRYVFFGVPYDRSSTYKAGSRFGPGAIRDVSANLELYSIRSDVDLEKVPVHDMGDVDTVEDSQETLKRVTSVWSELVAADKIPIMVGGEHTITKAAIDALRLDLGLTPLDLRRSSVEKTAQRIRSFLAKSPHAYVTVDIDALDPAYAPGVGNPEPDGLSTDELLTLVQGSMGRNIIGLDAVEVSPALDSGQTAAACAKVIFEAVAALSVRGL